MTEARPFQVFAALPSLFLRGGHLDHEGFARLVDYLGHSGLDGLVLFSEVAEPDQLSFAEKTALLKAMPSEGETLPFWVQIDVPSTREAGELAAKAEAAGAERLLLSAYRRPGFDYRGFYRHLELVSRETGLELILASRPGDALDALLFEEVQSLASHPRVFGMYLPHLGPRQLEPWVRHFEDSDGFGVISGQALQPRAAAKAGARAVISAAASVASHAAVSLREAMEAEAYPTVETLETKFLPLSLLLEPEIQNESRMHWSKLADRIADRRLDPGLMALSAPGLVKAALKQTGHPLRSSVRGPTEPVRAKDEEAVREALLRSSLLS